MVLSLTRQLIYLYNAPPLDNFISRLCYRWTVLLLLIFSFIITCRLWLGYSFSCISSSLSDVYATVKCYGNSVYTLPNKNSDIYPRPKPLSTDKHFLEYYSSVNLVFLVHAFNFYLPHLLWKSYERGYIYRLTAGVQKYLDKEEKRSLKLCHLAKYFFATQGKHKLYTLLYINFEIVIFVISLSHIYWLVHFFNVNGASNLTSNETISWSDYKMFYFPSEGFCSFKQRGNSGDFQLHEALCQLPLNALYMKMFLFLYAWYITLVVLTGLVLVYRILLLIPSVRANVCKLSSSLSETSVIKTACHQLSYTDWFFLSRLQNAMTDVDFAEVLNKISIMLQGKDPQSVEYKRFTVLDDAKLENLNITSPV